ncbi:hypothetical protein MKX01_030339 [Papaver californicum]|nr:hypothetical protein MKX01_030339 [Papaver californicum]
MTIMSKYVVVAASSTYIEKLFFMNCINGQLHVGTRNLYADGETVPCVPREMISSVHGVDGGEPQDGMLLWLEEHSRRLHGGIIQVHEVEKVKSINLFPEAPPSCSTSVTHGVKYPLLSPDGQEFVYQSCTPLPSSTGSVEGSFTFVPGRLTNPLSSPFRVEAGNFPLQLPEYVF